MILLFIGRRQDDIILPNLNWFPTLFKDLASKCNDLYRMTLNTEFLMKNKGHS